MEGGPLLGLVDIGLDDGAHLAAGGHRKIGLRKERWPARRRALLGIDQRPAARHGGGGLDIVRGTLIFVGVAFRKIVGDETRRAVRIVGAERKNLTELLPRRSTRSAAEGGHRPRWHRGHRWCGRCSPTRCDRWQSHRHRGARRWRRARSAPPRRQRQRCRRGTPPDTNARNPFNAKPMTGLTQCCSRIR